ncbi:MAG: Thiol:disulfide interchange protein DsbD precursor [Candidatus Hydrogenedentota bacterium]
MRSRLVTLVCVLALAGAASAQFGMSGPKVGYTSAASPQPDGSVRVAVQFSMDKPWHVNSHTPLEEFLIPTVLELGAGEGVTLESVVYPEHKLLKFDFSPEPLAVYEEKFTVGAVLRFAGVTPASVSFSLRYQACNDKQCAPPNNLDFEVPLGGELSAEQQALLNSVSWDKAASASPAEDAVASVEEAPSTETAAEGPGWEELIEGFTVVADTGYSSTPDFLAFIERGRNGGDSQEDGFWSLVQGGGSRGALAALSAPLLILVVLAGGFLLNLTPCVLPLIPINIGIIGAGARAGSKARGFALGGAFGLGIAASYGALGLLVVLGLSTAFGGMNATVWFNAGIAVLFVVLALGMFDIINIDFSRYQAKVGLRGNKSGSFAIAFAMGVISALLAGACVAPVVIYTILYAQDLYVQGNAFALALPFLLGIGMALPWPFAGGGLSFLPKPGAWMTRVKQAFGVFILGFAAYYGYVAWGIYDQKNVDPEAVKASVAALDEDGWLTSLDAGLAEAKAEGKPVLIDFWATWCKNCLVMNKTVLKEPEVLTALEDFVKIKYQAEDPTASPVKEVWEHFDLVGLPAYIILQPKQ